MTQRRMTAIVLSVVAFLGIAWLASRTTAAAENATDEVLKADDERNEALQKGNVAALEHIYADDLVYANATGALLTKQQHLADLKAKTLHFISFKHEDVKATVHGDTGLVTGVSKSEVEYKGSVSKSNRRFLNVFSKRDGRWLCVGHFETNISERE
jgi:ketosteroid isomerase-like protein